MYTPHTVTLFIVSESEDFAVNIDTTILRGVFLDFSHGSAINNAGVTNTSNATLYIPFSVKAVGLDGFAKQYVDSIMYSQMSDPSEFWTLTTSGSNSVADCYFVKGEIHNTLEYAEAKRLYPDVYRVSSVSTRDFGSIDMRHWQVNAV